MKALRIATRKSPLALWQAHHVAGLLRQHHPGLDVTFLELSTEGDRFLQAPLSAIGGKGLFIKEIEQALLDGRAELAVHSLKDVTSDVPAGLCLSATPEREDPRDAFVGRVCERLDQLPPGARVGTSSLRRAAQLLALRPDVEVVPLRGNVQSRLNKMEAQGLAGTLLASAGLKRLGLASRVTQVLPPELFLPAVGQGALALECHSAGEVQALLAPLDHVRTRQALAAERAFLAQLEGGCTVPLAAHAVIEDGMVWLRGLIARPDGQRMVRGEVRGGVAEAADLGRGLAKSLLSQGGAEILEAFRSAPMPTSTTAGKG